MELDQGMIQEIRDKFYADESVQAYQAIKRIESTLSPEAQSQLNQIEEVQLLKEDFALAGDCLKVLADLSSWNLVSQSSDIATYYKGSGSEFQIRAELKLDTPIFPILALISESDLITTWTSVFTECNYIAQPSRFSRLMHYKLNIPWPLNDRDLLIRCNGIPMPNNQAAMLIFKSLEAPAYLGVEAPVAENVRVEVKFGCIYFKMHDENNTHVSIVLHIDPKIEWIPDWFQNFATKHGIYYFMEGIQKKCHEYSGSVFEERVQSKPEYYQFIQDKILETRRRAENQNS